MRENTQRQLIRCIAGSVAILAAYPGICQEQQNPSAGSLVFSIASIKRSDLNHANLPFRIGPDSLSSSGTLAFFIEQAYDVKEVTGGSPWSRSDVYEVRAKAEHAMSPHQIRVMLQALLADRFGLKLHRESRTMRGFALIVEKGGAKLPAPKSGIPPGSRGTIALGKNVFMARGATMKTVAVGLRNVLGGPVVDETKIEGNYDFMFQFDRLPDELALQPGGAATSSAPGAHGSVFSALHDLGLRLDGRKLDVEVVVIDSAHVPSDN
jgi:uncharacterized protein (TIGR03435 family)